MRNQLILSVLFCAALVSSAGAAQPDEAWLAWSGCWRPDGDNSGRALCIVPDAEGVRMLTIKGLSIESESRIIANGQPRNISQEGCSGNETASWSADRQRVFLTADLNCGNSVTRKVSGVFVMLSQSQWASIQSIQTAGTTRMHTVRYVEAEPANLPPEVVQALKDNRLARETVRIAASSKLDLADVREAVTKTQVDVVSGWITTVGQEFDLDANTLVELADAGVPAEVIDVLVAVSHPGHFAVREERALDREVHRTGGRCYDAYWMDPYDPFGYRGSYYGSGCRGGGWGLTPWGGYYGGGTVIVIDRGGADQRPRGKATKEGYKSGRRDNDDSSGSGSVTRDKAPSTSRPSGSSDDSSNSSSSGGGEQRKAKPRER